MSRINDAAEEWHQTQRDEWTQSAYYAHQDGMEGGES